MALIAVSDLIAELRANALEFGDTSLVLATEEALETAPMYVVRSPVGDRAVSKAEALRALDDPEVLLEEVAVKEDRHEWVVLAGEGIKLSKRQPPGSILSALVRHVRRNQELMNEPAGE